MEISFKRFISISQFSAVLFRSDETNGEQIRRDSVAQIQSQFCRTFFNDSKDVMRWISCRIACKTQPEQRLQQQVRPPVTFVLASNLPKGSNFFIMNRGEQVFSICGCFTSHPHTHIRML